MVFSPASSKREIRTRIGLLLGTKENTPTPWPLAESFGGIIQMQTSSPQTLQRPICCAANSDYGFISTPCFRRPRAPGYGFQQLARLFAGFLVLHQLAGLDLGLPPIPIIIQESALLPAGNNLLGSCPLLLRVAGSLPMWHVGIVGFFSVLGASMEGDPRP